VTATSSISLRRRADRTAVVASLAVTTAAAWILTVQLAGGRTMPVESMDMASAMPSAEPQLLFVAAMWAAMMIGMMVPSATPMVLAYADWTRPEPTTDNRPGAVASFLSGYVVVWLGFSVLAAIVQVALERVDVLTAMGAISRPAVAGTVLVLAGVFQVTPWKESCLRRCRTPVGFLIAEWRDGPRGAVVMGIRHGVYCLGCCWQLMAVLFVVGTMHLAWMAAVAGFVLVEKVAPRSLHISHAAAAVLIGWGAWTLLSAAA